MKKTLTALFLLLGLLLSFSLFANINYIIESNQPITAPIKLYYNLNNQPLSSSLTPTPTGYKYGDQVVAVSESSTEGMNWEIKNNHYFYGLVGGEFKDPDGTPGNNLNCNFLSVPVQRYDSVTGISIGNSPEIKFNKEDYTNYFPSLPAPGGMMSMGIIIELDPIMTNSNAASNNSISTSKVFVAQ